MLQTAVVSPLNVEMISYTMLHTSYAGLRKKLVIMKERSFFENQVTELAETIQSEG